MAYYDLFIAPVEDAKRGDYEAFIKEQQRAFLKLGAIEIVDLWADDVPDGKVTSLPMAVKCEPGEAVAAGWVVWPSKDVRDARWAKMMEEDGGEMPMDGRRLIFGGFSEVAAVKA